jgi:hypothetical protein
VDAAHEVAQCLRQLRGAGRRRRWPGCEKPSARAGHGARGDRHSRRSRTVTAVFSLLIYYWALAVALPTEQIEEMINEVVVPEEETVV